MADLLDVNAKLLEKTDRYLVRHFEGGDEEAIVRVSDNAYKSCGGYTRKSPEYWRWCCLQRPDVAKEGVTVALDKKSKEIVGYVVAGKSGNLWEMCYNPNVDAKEIVALLLNKATSYLESQGASSITFNALKTDKAVKEFCKKNGFSINPTPQMFLSVLNFQKLVSAVANYKATELAKFNEEMLIKVSSAPFWIENAVSIKISKDGVAVGDSDCKPTIDVRVDYLTLSSLFFGKISPLKCFVRLRLKVKPLSKVPVALKILSILQINSEWSFQLSDFG